MKGAIAWFAKNGVAANLLMLVVIVAGVFSMMTIKQETFPEFSIDMITVTVEYLGAAPEEVEEAVCVRVEEKIQAISGIEKISSSASEGRGTVNIELMTGADMRAVLDEVKAQVDTINTFPEEVEKPVVQEMTRRRQVISVSVSGEADESTIKQLGEQIRDEIAGFPEITQVELVNARPYEISIEVSEDALRRYGLKFDDVAAAVRRSSLDLPGGSVKTEGGEILLRGKGQAYRGPDFERIVLISRRDGVRLELGDVAKVVDGFAETDQFSRFDGKRSVMVRVFRVGDQNALRIAELVRGYIRDAQPRMPEGIRLTTWQDDSVITADRLDLMLRNGRNGLIFVLIVLTLFLRLRLSFWVSLGIPISFLGALWMLPLMEISINQVSLFAFIIVLGIVVDDAIIIGENIFAHYQRGKSGVTAAIDGAQEMAVPVIFAVLTSVAAFTPLMILPGTTGKIFRVAPMVVIPALLFSLVECLLILPAHLSHLRHAPAAEKPRRRSLSEVVDGRLKWWIDHTYRPVLNFCMHWRYLTVAAMLTILLFTVGWVGAGNLKFAFFPVIEADNITASLTMPMGTPVEVTSEAVRLLEESAERVRQQLDEEGVGGDESVFRHVLASVGSHPSSGRRRGPPGTSGSSGGSHLGEVDVELVSGERRSLSSREVANLWREATGAIPDAVLLDFTDTFFSAGDDIDVQLTGPRVEVLRAAADELQEKIRQYPGVFDLSDSFRGGKQEIKLQVRPQAETLGVTHLNLARQVRQAFYGEEAQRIQRGRDDVKVMVRYPQEQRRSLGDLEDMRIRIPGGAEVPFSTVANAEYGRSYASIQRVDRHRAINVTAKVDATKGNPNEIIASLEAGVLPDVLSRYPGVRYSFEGQQREQLQTVDSLVGGFILTIMMIYALLAVPLKSYVQPLIIMSAIPFGVVGAVWGHSLMGIENFTMLSLMGVVALAGVVVNDSLVLVDYVNRSRRAGMEFFEAVRNSGAARFRPILLTSLTTFVGLLPLIHEKSLNAQFLLPMAVSLAYGVLFSTFVTLLLVPAEYLIVEDLKRLVAHLLGTGSHDEFLEEPVAPPPQ